MRILQALHFFLPRHSAGTEVYTATLARELSKQHDVSLFFSEKNLSRSPYSLHRRDWEGIPCYEVTNNLCYPGFEETFSNPAVDAAFAEVLAEVQPDVLHIQHLMLLSLNVIRLAKERGIPVVMTLHDFWLYCARFGQLLRGDGSICDGPRPAKCASCLADFKFSQSATEEKLIRAIHWTRRVSGFDLAPLVGWARGSNLPITRFARKLTGASPAPRTDQGRSLEAAMAARQRAVQELAKNVDIFVIPSKTIRDRVVKWGIPRSKVRLIRHGIEADSIDPEESKTREFAVDGHVRFGFVGTIAPHKGVHTAIEAIKHLGDANASLKVFGRMDYYPDYGAHLKNLAKDAPVTFRGRVARERLGRAFHEIDCLIMPSLWLENAPMVIQESALAGVPVIASNLGGMAELVKDRQGGRLFKAGNARDLARKMKEVIRQPSILYQWSRKAGKPKSIEKHIAEITDIYAELEAAKEPPARGRS